MSAKIQKCSICDEWVMEAYNKAVAPCGHIYHCSCLIQHVVNNRIVNCVCCQKYVTMDVMSNKNDIYDYTLTSFRMFYQRIFNEEVEDEPLIENVSVYTESYSATPIENGSVDWYNNEEESDNNYEEESDGYYDMDPELYDDLCAVEAPEWYKKLK
jgi:hypothetical protein